MIDVVHQRSASSRIASGLFSLISPFSARSCGDLRFGAAELGQDLVRMLAESRRRRSQARAAVPHHDSRQRRRTRDRSSASTWSKRWTRPRVADLIERKRFGHGQDASGGHAGRVERAAPIRRRIRDGSAASISAVSAARLRLRASRAAKRSSSIRSSRSISRASASNCSCLLAAMLSRPSAGPERAGRRGGEIVVAHRRRLLAGDQIVRDDPAHRRDRGIEHRHVDEAPFARLRRGRRAQRRWRRRRSSRRCCRRRDSRPAAARCRASPVMLITPDRPWTIWS